MFFLNWLKIFGMATNYFVEYVAVYFDNFDVNLNLKKMLVIFFYFVALVVF